MGLGWRRAPALGWAEVEKTSLRDQGDAARPSHGVAEAEELPPGGGGEGVGPGQRRGSTGSAIPAARSVLAPGFAPLANSTITGWERGLKRRPGGRRQSISILIDERVEVEGLSGGCAVQLMRCWASSRARQLQC